MDLVARGAGYQVSGVAALDASGVCGPAQMTRQTRAVRLRRRKFRRITDIRGGRRFRVLRSRPVTRFAGLFDSVVRIFLEGFPDIFVARKACFRARIAGLLSWRACNKRQHAERGQNGSRPSIARVLCQR